ncbi:MAG: hypothetical protein KJ941_11650 [Bacteroidetes bacterium]|nr:hypothetical protein [Bacteroidota bacterium]
MKKILFILSILLSLVSFGQAQKPNSIPIVAYWSIGDSYDFKITKTKEKQNKAGQMVPETFRYIANFEVIDSSDVRYKIRWTFKNDFTRLNIPNEVLEELGELDISEVIYYTDELGSFLEIENWQEISNQMREVFDRLTTIMTASAPEKRESFELMMKPIFQVYQSKEGLENKAFEELRAFHFPFGFEFNSKQVLKYQDELPNMFGGKPIKAETNIIVENYNYEDSYCELKQTMKLNETDTKRVVMEYLKMTGMSNQEVTKAMKKAVLKINDDNRYHLFYYPGVPYSIQMKRNIIIDINGSETKRNELIKIEILE